MTTETIEHIRLLRRIPVLTVQLAVKWLILSLQRIDFILMRHGGVIPKTAQPDSSEPNAAKPVVIRPDCG